jgi:hypothetical protein
MRDAGAVGVIDQWYGNADPRLCRHAARVKTCATGVEYCQHCGHWLGTRKAFDRLPRREDRGDRRRWLFLEEAEVPDEE